MTAPRRALLEICAASVTDVLEAESAGADRVELNSAMLLGGLTPSPGCLQLTLERATIPVIAMARPRASGFCYSNTEFETLLRDVHWLIEGGVAGIAFGVLDSRGAVDVARTRQVVAAIGPERDAVFHRAFDLAPDHVEALETLIECQVRRVMTSGGQATAMQGSAAIQRLVQQAGDRIEILAAGGIRSDHVRELLDCTGVGQVHAGPSAWTMDKSWREGCPVNLYGIPPDHPGHFRRGSPQAMQDLLAALEG
ncbi:MAG: copper homeostasis protein CutC [Pirellulaceae bacterium]